MQNQENILKSIIDSIINSNFIVSDLTNSNPNVYYEMALAHAYKKNVILISQNIEDAPFDIRSYRIIKYGTYFSEMRKAIQEMEGLICKIKEGDINFGSPITDFAATVSVSENKEKYSMDGAMQLLSFDPQGQESSEDMGILDYQVKALDGIEKMTNSLESLNDDFLSPIAVELKENTDSLLDNNSPNAKRKIMRNFSSRIDHYTKIISDNNLDYRISLEEMDIGLNGMFDVDVPISDEERTELRKFIEEFSKMDGRLDDVIAEMDNLVSTMDSLPKIEKNFHQSKRSLSSELKIHIDNLNNTKSIVSRALNMANNLMNG